jgi:hypothetical protein
MSVSPNSIINLSAATVVIVEPTNQGMEILTQICFGFGVRTPHRCSDASEAMALLAKRTVDLLFCSAAIRRSEKFCMGVIAAPTPSL